MAEPLTQNTWGQVIDLAGSTVSALHFANGDSLWVGVEDQGLMRFVNGVKDTVYNMMSSDIPSDRVESISLEADGGIWLGTPDGLTHFESGVWTSYYESDGPAQ